MNDAADVRVFDAHADARWNAYVERHPAAGFFHLSEWASVYAALPWVEPCFLGAFRDDAIVGVMPLAAIRFGPGRSAVVSAPYCVQAGALADDEATVRALESRAAAIAADTGARFLEVRQTGSANPGWTSRDGFAAFHRDLVAGADANLARIPRKQRAMIRKGEAAGLEARVEHDPALFYRLFSTSMRDLGTPVYSRRLFEAIWVHLGAHVETLFVRDRDGPVAAVMSFRFGGTIMPYYAGAIGRARALHAHDFMYWEVMRRAAGSGCTHFDFGRSVRGSGAYAFKRHWGFEPQPLVYQFATASARAGELDPDSPFNRVARTAWKRLPLGVANVVGPVLARRLY